MRSITVPQGVGVQLARLGGIVTHAEQVIDRVLVLFSAQSIMRHRRPRRHPRRPALLEPRIEIRDERRDLVLRRLRFSFFGGISPAIDLFDDLRPAMRVHARLEIARELVDAQIPLLLLRAMAADAVLLEECFERFRSADGASKAKTGNEEQA